MDPGPHCMLIQCGSSIGSGSKNGCTPQCFPGFLPVLRIRDVSSCIQTLPFSFRILDPNYVRYGSWILNIEGWNVRLTFVVIPLVLSGEVFKDNSSWIQILDLKISSWIRIPDREVWRHWILGPGSRSALLYHAKSTRFFYQQ
jgi:hypothetical protein